MTTPANGKIYSVNEGNWFEFSDGVRTYIDDCKRQKMSARYIGSLVADFHRNLLKGGIYLYPGHQEGTQGQAAPALRSEHRSPMIVEQAGGHGHRWHCTHPGPEAHRAPPALPAVHRQQERWSRRR
jgi:fructose-1,6-bisphosphatase I